MQTLNIHREMDYSVLRHTAQLGDYRETVQIGLRYATASTYMMGRCSQDEFICFEMR
jgi:hypothetical protein